jgi:hypothetical protein
MAPPHQIVNFYLYKYTMQASSRHDTFIAHVFMIHITDKNITIQIYNLLFLLSITIEEERKVF